MEELGLFDLVDNEIAALLGVSKEVYVKKIEGIPERRANIILNGLVSTDSRKVEKAIRTFKLIE